MRHYVITTLLLLISGQSFADCPFPQEIFNEKIKPKIAAGIPFEIVAITLDNKEIIGRTALHITFDLWTEIATMKSNQKVTEVKSWNQINNFICESFKITHMKLKSGTYKYKILLNPMWTERIRNLKNTVTVNEDALLKINWDSIAKEMKEEQILYSTSINM